jgi:Pyridoxamine 5'-phosphate oxidase
LIDGDESEVALGKLHESISPELGDWLAKQSLFFVATAPLAAEGLLNCSPKGMDTFRVLTPTRVGYLDLTGSGVETIAHIRENRRIVLMFCSFSGSPKIVRLHGNGTVHTPASDEYRELRSEFPDYPGERAIIVVDLVRISDSCGYAVPRFQHLEERDTLVRWAEKKSPEELAEYRRKKNAKSIDHLPGLDSAESDVGL